MFETFQNVLITTTAPISAARFMVKVSSPGITPTIIGTRHRRCRDRELEARVKHARLPDSSVIHESVGIRKCLFGAFASAVWLERVASPASHQGLKV